jgi:uncharacterized iron-regulated membrane protein
VNAQRSVALTRKTQPWDHSVALEAKPNLWRQWVEQPQKVWLHNLFFQIHFWVGAVASAYIGLMGVTGSVLVFYNQLGGRPAINRLAHLHSDLLAGQAGRFVNGIGGLSLTLLCLTGAVIWWPGVKHWRRSLRVEWRARFPRINWDVHSALGFWAFLFVLLWGVSGTYLTFPRLFDGLYFVDPSDKFADTVLSVLSQLHFGRFGWVSETVWAVLGLALAVLAFTGTFVCCRRVIYKKPSNPYR